MRTDSERNANGMLPSNLVTQEPSNPIPNKQNKNTTSPSAPKFSFREKLVEHGVQKQHIDDWLKVRQKKKATNTLTAWNKFKTQVEKTGHSFDDVVQLCVEKDWKGFEAAWVANTNLARHHATIQAGEIF